jgi:sugar/nucleoside kinase (ribokinase family)
MACQSLLFCGAACCDIILEVERYPEEDSEQRVLRQSQAAGGNAANSSVVAAWLTRNILPELGSLKCVTKPLLLAAISDAESDGNARFISQCLHAAGADTSMLISVAPFGLPTSYITVSRASGSRTIVHSRTIRELTWEDMQVAIKRGTPQHELVDATGSLDLCRLSGVHVEGRSLVATKQFLTHLHSLRARPLISLEVEKHRADGSVVDELAPLADVVFYSQEYLRGEERGGERGHAEALVRAQEIQAAAVAKFNAHGDTTTSYTPYFHREYAFPRVIVVPWGREGSKASIRCNCSVHKGENIHVTVLAHPPSSSGGRIVDTIGAGDSFIAAFMVFVTFAISQDAFNPATHCLGDVITAILTFSSVVAGEKVGIHGFDLAAACEVLRGEGRRLAATLQTTTTTHVSSHSTP